MDVSGNTFEPADAQRTGWYGIRFDPQALSNIVITGNRMVSEEDD